MSPQPVASLAELAARHRPSRVEVGGVTVCVVRTERRRSTPSTTSARHADVSLSEGEVDGDTIECWLHGSRFDLVTGQPVRPAGDRSRSPSTR